MCDLTKHIAIISTLFKRMLKYTSFSQGWLLLYSTQLQSFISCSVICSFVFHWTWHCLQFSNLNLHFQMKSCVDLMRNAGTLSACTPLFRGSNSKPVAWVLVAQLGIMFAHASAILPKLLSRGAKHMWKEAARAWEKNLLFLRSIMVSM